MNRIKLCLLFLCMYCMQKYCCAFEVTQAIVEEKFCDYAALGNDGLASVAIPDSYKSSKVLFFTKRATASVGDRSVEIREGWYTLKRENQNDARIILDEAFSQVALYGLICKLRFEKTIHKEKSDCIVQ